jgi:hypothetical protein
MKTAEAHNAELTGKIDPPQVLGRAFIKPTFNDIRTLFKGLTDEERLTIFADYCAGCGSKDPRCRCTDDLPRD